MASTQGITAVLLVVAALGMFLLFRATPSAEPFDPRSGSSSGTRGLVLVLEKLTRKCTWCIRWTRGRGSSRRVLVLHADLSDRQTQQLDAFATSGGIVVWADPAVDPFVETDVLAAAGDGLDTVGGGFNVPLNACSLQALQHLTGVLSPSGVLLRADARALTCFGDEHGSFVAAVAHGDGFVIHLGDNRADSPTATCAMPTTPRWPQPCWRQPVAPASTSCSATALRRRRRGRR